MAYKQFVIGDDVSITVYKRRAARNLKLSIASDGQIRVSIPTWAPYKAGIEFASSRINWIESHKPEINLIQDGQPIGKAHHIHFIPQATDKITTRVKQGEIVVNYPDNLNINSTPVQAKAEKAAIRALKSQAESLLPKRLEVLSDQHGLPYNSVQIKRLKSRWGSCDQDKNIILNLYLMQIPWHLIDYVLLHELTHTEVLKHGPEFWSFMDGLLPDGKALRKELKGYKTSIS